MVGYGDFKKGGIIAIKFYIPQKKIMKQIINFLCFFGISLCSFQSHATDDPVIIKKFGMEHVCLSSLCITQDSQWITNKEILINTNPSNSVWYLPFDSDPYNRVAVINASGGKLIQILSHYKNGALVWIYEVNCNKRQYRLHRVNSYKERFAKERNNSTDVIYENPYWQNFDMATVHKEPLTFLCEATK